MRQSKTKSNRGIIEIRASIDPSGNSVGLALWDDKIWDELVPPFLCYVITPIYDDELWHNKIADVAGQVREILDNYHCTTAYIETPTYFETNRGQTAARTDSLVKLASAYGAIVYALSFCCDDIETVEIAHWKGQLPKSVVIKRIKQLIPGVSSTPGLKLDAWDATGLGLYKKGFLNQ